jgi:hypothetical protein
VWVSTVICWDPDVVAGAELPEAVAGAELPAVVAGAELPAAPAGPAQAVTRRPMPATAVARPAIRPRRAVPRVVVLMGIRNPLSARPRFGPASGVPLTRGETCRLPARFKFQSVKRSGGPAQQRDGTLQSNDWPRSAAANVITAGKNRRIPRRGARA